MIGAELETVELKVADRVAWVILNRPEALNAALFVTPQSADKLRAALTKAGAEPLTPTAETDRAAWVRDAVTRAAPDSAKGGADTPRRHQWG